MYSDIIIENFSAPQNMGDIASADIAFEVGNSVCGDRIRIQIELAEETISKAVFRAWGCATSIATANIFCSSLNGQAVASIVLRDNDNIASMLGGLEPSQHHCLDILHELHQHLIANLQEEEVVNG